MSGFCNSSGNTVVCTACAAGYYTDTTTATSCSPCTNNPGAYGTFAGPGTNATSCTVSCYAGAYLVGGVCALCALGSYASSSGLNVCTVCPVGSSTLSTGATSVYQCICAQDYYQSGTACVACRTCSPSGYKVSSCTAGSTSDVSACACNAGYLKDGWTCVCPSGYFSSGSCLPCTNGNSYSTYTGPWTTATNCPVTCIAGFYVSGGSFCTPCAFGTYSAGGRATVCGNGTNSYLGAVYTSSGTTATGCSVACPVNYY